MRGGEVFVEASVCTESKLQRGPMAHPGPRGSPSRALLGEMLESGGV